MLAMQKRFFAMLVALLAPSLAYADITSLSGVTALVDFTEVSTALFTVAGVVIAVLITIRGIRWVFSMTRR